MGWALFGLAVAASATGAVVIVAAGLIIRFFLRLRARKPRKD